MEPGLIGPALSVSELSYLQMILMFLVLPAIPGVLSDVELR